MPLHVARGAQVVEEQGFLYLSLEERFKFLAALLISFCGSRVKRNCHRVCQWSYLIQCDLKEKQTNAKCFALG